jgi:hypothetical protein
MVSPVAIRVQVPIKPEDCVKPIALKEVPENVALDAIASPETYELSIEKIPFSPQTMVKRPLAESAIAKAVPSKVLGPATL